MNTTPKNLGEQMSPATAKKKSRNRGDKQKKHKKRVMNLRASRCPITGLSNPLLLRNSHIKPVSKSEDKEKYDVENGFPFAPQVDALFDGGYISFKDNGEMLVSSLVSDDDLKCLGIDKTKKLELKHSYTRKYMKWHRKNEFEKFKRKNGQIKNQLLVIESKIQIIP